MATRTMRYAAMAVCLLCCGAGRSIADGKLPQAPTTSRPRHITLAHPSDPVYYTFTGHPAIRTWSSVPRRT